MPPAAPPAESATLLVSCPDRRGIVAALAQLLLGHGANILESDQYSDPVAALFFQRIHLTPPSCSPTAARSSARSPRWRHASR
jgi:formyltetrahydrofolate deformylase